MKKTVCLLLTYIMCFVYVAEAQEPKEEKKISRENFIRDLELLSADYFQSDTASLLQLKTICDIARGYEYCKAEIKRKTPGWHLISEKEFEKKAGILFKKLRKYNYLDLIREAKTQTWLIEQQNKELEHFKDSGIKSRAKLAKLVKKFEKQRSKQLPLISMINRFEIRRQASSAKEQPTGGASYGDNTCGEGCGG